VFAAAPNDVDALRAVVPEALLVGEVLEREGVLLD
jgi:hypothetical protein